MAVRKNSGSSFAYLKPLWGNKARQATGSTHAFYYHGNNSTRRGKYGPHTWHPAGSDENPVAPSAAACASGTANPDAG